jgi:hypothetical protein
VCIAVLVAPTSVYMPKLLSEFGFFSQYDVKCQHRPLPTIVLGKFILYSTMIFDLLDTLYYIVLKVT